MMLPEVPPDFLPLLALYPEIHYRFKYFPFSRYFRRQPEIIADAPKRLDPGEALPILLIIKDADRFPIKLISIRIEAKANDRCLSQKIDILPELIKVHWWHHIEWIKVPNEAPCNWIVNVYWTAEINGKEITFQNDNIPGTSHRPLIVKQSGHPLPGKDGWIFGDLHAHTAFTEDHVEFGAPLSSYPVLGQAAGLKFTLAADHSYDLDDQPGSFLEQDPDLLRFKSRNSQLLRLNQEHKGQFCILPGYELSAGNQRGQNIHLLLLNQTSFLPGSGDSAERWLETKPELSIEEALQRMDEDALGIAAHPTSKIPLLQRLLLRRGIWEGPDFDHERLTGLQIWNGKIDMELQTGIARWVDGLLSGRKWKIYAGSDAHGNFNHHVKVNTPMVKLSEMDDQQFGDARTGIHLADSLSMDNVIKCLRSGKNLITDGPFADLSIINSGDSSFEIRVEAISSPEFGELSKIILLSGKRGESKERILRDENLAGIYQAGLKLIIPKQCDYLRVETRTLSGKRAYTNAVFVNDCC